MASYAPQPPHETLDVLGWITARLFTPGDPKANLGNLTIAIDERLAMNDVEVDRIRDRLNDARYEIVHPADQIDWQTIGEMRLPEQELDRLQTIFLDTLEEHGLAEAIHRNDLRTRLTGSADLTALPRRIVTGREVETWLGDELVGVEPLPHNAA